MYMCTFNENHVQDEISTQERISKTMFLKFEHYDLAISEVAISEVSHYGFLRGHSSIS
jgi:hypothetical protein